MHPLFGEMANMQVSSKNLIFHLLDIHSRDQRIERETEEVREVVYESGQEDSDEECKSRVRARAGKGVSGTRREFIIHLFGETVSGQSVRIDVVGFRPCFYLRLPEERTNAAIDAICKYMEHNGIPSKDIVTKKVSHETFFGFSARTKFPFLYIDFPSLGMWREAKNLFVNDKSLPCTKQQLAAPFKKGESPDVYEANIDPMLRFLHYQNIAPCGWIEIEDGVEAAEDEDGVLTLTCDFECVEPCKAPPRPSGPFLIASWDIECFSATGEFPIAKKPGWDRIAKVLSKYKSGIEIKNGLLKLIDDNILVFRGNKRGGESKARSSLENCLLNPEFQEQLNNSIGAPNTTVGKILADNLGRYVEPHGDPVIQIGISLTRDCKVIDRHLFVWPTCAPCDGIVLHTYPDEKQMISGFFKWFVEINPDIILGYNIFGFDEKYLWERAEELGCVGEGTAVHGLNRLHDSGSNVKLEEKFLSSSALGDNFMYIWSAQGRLQIDLYHYIRRTAVLPSYKLDEVTKNYMSGKLKSYDLRDDKLYLTVAGAVKDIRAGRAICLLDATGESITEKMVIESVDGSTICVNIAGDAVVDYDDAQKWVIVKDDVTPQDIFRLHRGSAEDRAIVGRYCLQDCDLVLELYKKLEVFNNAMSMANVCSVPISYIFTRGQGIKAESLIFRACRERGILIPVLPAPKQKGSGEEEDSYEGAIVLDPVPGFYHKSPIGVADFASLYPSTIESENISHDSLVWVKDFTYDGRLVATQFGSDHYDECDGYGYTDIEFDIWRPDPADKRKHPVKVKVGRRICRFAQPLDGTKSTLPEIIRGLLAARKAKRKEAAGESDPERAALLDAEQLAYKLTGNSLYGQLGSGTFKVRLQHLAASVTAYGRKQIMFAKAVIERFYGLGGVKGVEGGERGHGKKEGQRGVPALGGAVLCDAKIMYGDTDSLFVEFNPRDPKTGDRLTGREARQAVIDLTAEAGKLVTKALKPPHDFEFDKIFDPMLMFSKKRYAGHMFEENADDYVHKYMGIALKRRDNAPFVKTVFGNAMKKLLLERDVPGSVEIVKRLCGELVDGKVSLNQLTITKSLRADYADPARIAHKALADRMAIRDPGNAPASGDRIGYVYIRPEVGQVEAKLQGDRIESPAYVREKGLVLDYRFYIEHQIQNPVSQMFGIVLDEMPGFDKRLLADCPVETDRAIAWREEKAAELLFSESLRRCNTSDKNMFMSKYFGVNTAAPRVVAVRGGKEVPVAASSKTDNTNTVVAPRRVTQAPMSNFLLDSFIGVNIRKKEREEKKAKEAEKESKLKTNVSK